MVLVLTVVDDDCTFRRTMSGSPGRRRTWRKRRGGSRRSFDLAGEYPDQRILAGRSGLHRRRKRLQASSAKVKCEKAGAAGMSRVKKRHCPY